MFTREQTSAPSRPSTRLYRGAVASAFLLILLLAAWLRLSHLDWDGNQHLHPDERFLTMVVTAEQWPHDVREYLDESRSPLNPRNVGFPSFVYGTLPTTLVKGLSLWRLRADYDGVTLVGRTVSAVADLGTLALLCWTAFRLYADPRIALLAALLYGASVLPVQHAHFFVVDPLATLFVTAATCALAGPRRDTGAFAAAGVCLGLALACKASMFTFGFIVALAALGTWHWRGPRSVVRPAVQIALAALCAAIAFRLAQPDAFHGPGLLGVEVSARWLRSLFDASQLMSGDIDFPPGVQWANRAMLWFPLWNTVVWGLGPPLGVTACAAVIVAAWQLIRGDARHLIPVVWVLLVFVPQGTQFVKAARYLLPIYPMLALLAAWMLVRYWDDAGGRSHAIVRSRWAAGAVVVLVAGGTVAWAVAFTGVYRRPNTRVQASRWIYTNVPPGTALATEHWDDRLPLVLGDVRPERYVSIELTNYDEDTPEKLDALVSRLDRAAYVILASNRLYDSIPRLPMRYPMTVRYYDALFSGALGFDRVADFTSYPGLGPFEVRDQSAEESFSVYDHARVQIFRKSARWDAVTAHALLGQVDWSRIVRLDSRDAANYKNGLMLSPPAWRAVRSGGTWSSIFDPESLANHLPIVAWCVAVEVLGFIAFLIAAPALARLPDEGWLLSKSLGLLFVAYPGWLLASLQWAAFQRSTLLVVCASLGAVAAVFAWMRRSRYRRLWQERRRLLVGEEALFWLAFAAFVAIRSTNPDLWHPAFGGEKPMDFAYLNAVTRSDFFPPYDPWFAGGYLNYYYFGFVPVAALTKLTGIVPQVAYNLAVATFFALAVGGAFTVAYAVFAGLSRGADGTSSIPRVQPWMCGLAGALFVTAFGNLVEFGLLLRAMIERSWTAWPHWVWYWNASRAIAHPPTEVPPITEFPFFTFLYGDLHAHMLALPYTLAVLACVVALVMPVRTRQPAPGAATIALLSLLLGSLYAINAWDYPTFAAIAALGVLLREAARGWLDRLEIAAGRAAWRVAVLLAAGQLLFAPFSAHFSRGYGALQLWAGSHTSLRDYLSVHGFFLFVLAGWAVWQAANRWSRWRDRQTLPLRLLLGGIVSVLGLALSVAVELVVVAGAGRMDTVFKVYFQVWTLWGLSAAVCGGLVVCEWRERGPLRRTTFRRRVQVAWTSAAVVLTLACLAYPLIAPFARHEDRFEPTAGFTLDGQKYMQSAVHVERGQPFALRFDLDAIRWLQEHVIGTPVIAEAHTAEYHWGGRISANTGLPAILGWSWHETQQRRVIPADMLTRREADIWTIYTDTNTQSVRAAVDRYDVDYVYVGALERISYPGDGLQKFDADSERWECVYRNREVAIYRVVR